MNAQVAYNILIGAWSREELFKCAISDTKTAIALINHPNTTKEERQSILIKHTCMSDYADLLKKSLLTNKEEEYLLNIAFSNSSNDVINYLVSKRKIKPNIEANIIKFMCGHIQSAYRLISTNNAFKKLTEESQNKLYEALTKDSKYAYNLLRDKPDGHYRDKCMATMLKTGEGAYTIYSEQKRFKLTREEEDKCIAKIATLKSYLKPLLNNFGMTLWVEQVDIIVNTVADKQDLELIKIVWDMITLSDRQKTKLEPFMVAARLMKAK
jgi:hypothetical protein